MAALSKKRKLNESDFDSDDDEFNEPPLKKMKISLPHLFDCWNMEEFQSTYNAIESSELIRNLQVPSDLSQQIAFNTIGLVIDCNNDECKNKIIDPPKGHENEDCDKKLFRQFLRKDGEGWQELGYFCADCFDKTKQCKDCNVWKMKCSKEICSVCSIEIDPCEVCAQEGYNCVYECVECSANMCRHCVTYCDDCEEELCTQCLLSTGAARRSRKTGTGICGECDDCLQLSHVNCTAAVDLRHHQWQPCAFYNLEQCDEVVCAEHNFKMINCKTCGGEQYLLFCKEHMGQDWNGECSDCQYERKEKEYLEKEEGQKQRNDTDIDTDSSLSSLSSDSSTD